jgi:hypothetical protein
MINQLNLVATELLMVSAYGLFISAVIYCLSELLIRYYPLVKSWRSYWLMALVCSFMPLLYIVAPEPVLPSINLSLFELGLGFHGAVDQSFDSITTPSNVTSLFYDLTGFSWSELNGLAFSWLIIYCIGLLIHSFRLLHSYKKVESMINGGQSITSKDFTENFKCSHSHSVQNNHAYKSEQAFNRRIIKLQRLQRSAKIKIVITKQAVSPFIVEWPKPVLVLSSQTLKDLTEIQFDLMLKHELTHLRRHDGLIGFGVQFAQTLVWFNPFSASMIRNLNWATEASCDQIVLRRQPSLRKTYAHAMLKVLRRSATEHSNYSVAAFSSKTHRSITMRIKHIMDPSTQGIKSSKNKVCLWTGALGICLASYSFQPLLHAAPEQVTNGVSAKQSISMINPVKNARLSSNYGVKNKHHQFHNGIDLAAKLDTPIAATAAGVVSVSTDHLEGHKNYGSIIIIDHGNGLQSLYSHLNSRQVSVGDKVERGQLIGKVGETGKATGPHVHFEIMSNSQRVDPNQYVRFDI